RAAELRLRRFVAEERQFELHADAVRRIFIRKNITVRRAARTYVLKQSLLSFGRGDAFGQGRVDYAIPQKRIVETRIQASADARRTIACDKVDPRFRQVFVKFLIDLVDVLS